MLYRLLSFVLLAAAIAGPAHAQREKIVPPEGANWRSYAEQYLTIFRENRPFSAARDTSSRCIRMNNYGCIWQARTPWQGTPGSRGEDGAHDGEGGPRGGHAIFVHPKWSIVAGMRWFERKLAEKPNASALELAAIYAPWCDTIGSRGTKADGTGRRWGRGCRGGNQPPAGFTGPRCGPPPNGVPSRRQCEACNCPTSVARYWLEGSGTASTAPLALFDAAGKPNQAFRSLIKRKTMLETGRFSPSDTLLDEASASFTPMAR